MLCLFLPDDHSYPYVHSRFATLFPWSSRLWLKAHDRCAGRARLLAFGLNAPWAAVSRGRVPMGRSPGPPGGSICPKYHVQRLLNRGRSWGTIRQEQPARSTYKMPSITSCRSTVLGCPPGTGWRERRKQDGPIGVIGQVDWDMICGSWNKLMTTPMLWKHPLRACLRSLQYVKLRLLPEGVIMSHSYSSDISREQFARILPCLESARRRTKPRTVDLYDVFCGVLYSTLRKIQEK